MEKKSEYIGEGVYASYDGYQIKLETLEGQVIYLDAHTYKALTIFAQRVGH